MLAAVLITLSLGYLVKAPCLSGDWADGRQYDDLCYSDVVALYATDRGVDRDLLPYLEARNEYPVLTGLSMWVAGLPANSFASFFNWTALLLTACALVVAWALFALAGTWALLFALAPTLAVHGFINWDLIAVAFATAGTWAFLRGRDAGAGLLLGLGAAAKLYPALFLVPFALQRVRERRAGRAGRLVGAAAVAWVTVNLPFALLAPGRWSEFFRFNAERPADWDTIWLPLQTGLRLETSTVNLLSALAFVAFGALVVWLGLRRGRPAWQLAFPLLVVFLLTSKVYSPQYSLWLLPWFALVVRDVRLFAAFSAADVMVFVTRFHWFGDYTLGEGPSGTFEAALIARGLILIACVVVWMHRDEPAAPAPAEAKAETVAA